MATMCIPHAQGVPGFWGQPPYWLPGHPTFAQNTNLDDPRWRGAHRRNFNGAATFRAVHHTEGGNKSLYLSWTAHVPQLKDEHDRLYVGFRPGGGGPAMVIFSQVHDSAAGSATAENVFSVAVHSGSGGAWSHLSPVPTWIAANTQMWRSASGTPADTWTVQMRVPNVNTSGSLTSNSGPGLGDVFSIWFGVWGGTATPIPIILAELPALDTTAADYLTNAFPNPNLWLDVSTIAGVDCPTTGGIVIQSTDVGTTNPVASRIQFAPGGGGPTNTFFARPRNYTGSSIPAGGISARFRIANWGSTVGPAAWVDIPGGGNVVSSSNIAPIAPPNPPPATNPLSFNWKLSAADVATFITGSTPHKCILVELDGSGLTFFNESVYRNMDFVTASRFERVAEISLKGLRAIPVSGPVRDVYLYVEKRNMPDSIGPGEYPPKSVTLPPVYDLPPSPDASFVPPERGEQQRPREVSYKEAVAIAKQGALEEETIQSFMPTYRVHVYHDTGERITVAGEDQPVLRPQSHFGYFVEHDGELSGWRDALDAPANAQLQEIAPNFYKIVVPEDGVGQITTKIESKEPGKPGEDLLEQVLKWLRSLPRWLLILLFVLFILLLIILA